MEDEKLVRRLQKGSRTALEQAPLALYAPPALWGWGAAVLLGAGLTARQARRWLAAPGVG